MKYISPTTESREKENKRLNKELKKWYLKKC